MKFDPSNPVYCQKHVAVEILHREIPVKNLYFPVRDCSVASVTATASFHQKNTDYYGLIITSIQMTNTSPFL